MLDAENTRSLFDPPLDTGINAAVLALREHGVDTFESCEGGSGHAYPEPTVRFHGDAPEGFRALAAAMKEGLPVAEQHLIYTNNDPKNPFSACVASDLYIPRSWIEDPQRREQTHIPENIVFRAKWEMAADQVEACQADGVRFAWITCDEEYTSVPAFIYRMDRLGQRLIGEVRSNFRCWTKPPACRSFQGTHASKRVDNISRFSPLFREQDWQRIHIKDTTRGACLWEVKAARVHLVDKDDPGRRRILSAKPSSVTRRHPASLAASCLTAVPISHPLRGIHGRERLLFRRSDAFPVAGDRANSESLDGLNSCESSYYSGAPFQPAAH